MLIDYGQTADIISHMAKNTTEKASDFMVLVSYADVDQEHLHKAFRRKRQWIIGDPWAASAKYATVLSNLTCRYIDSEENTINSVRDTLHKGLKRDAFDRLRVLIGATNEELRNTIGVPQRTLSRRDVFKQDESERILRVASLFHAALEVFEDIEKARQWFLTGKKALGGYSPLEFCDTEPGAEEVRNLLGRIEHGVFT